MALLPLLEDEARRELEQALAKLKVAYAAAASA